MKIPKRLRNVLMAVFFGILTVFFGKLYFEIPGANGVTSNFVEPVLLIGIPLMLNWYCALFMSLFTVFNVLPGGNTVAEAGNHVIGVLFMWFIYHKVLCRQNNILHLMLYWAAAVTVYYFAILIPFIPLYYLLAGTSTIHESLVTYLTIAKSAVYEYLVTIMLSLFFVLMMNELNSRKRAQKEIERINKDLESTIQQRTTELVNANTELTASNENLSEALVRLEKAQNHLVAQEKMAALGQLIAGISHELNTPIGAIISSSDSISEILDNRFGDMLAFIRTLSQESFQVLTENMETLPVRTGIPERSMSRRKKKDLIDFLADKNISTSGENVERLSDMGITDMDDKVLSFFSGVDPEKMIKTLHTYSELVKLNRIIAIGGEKTSRVVNALQIYSDQMDNDEMVDLSIRDEIEIILVLYQNFTKHGINIVRHYASAGNIRGSKPRLAQVWINLLTNAIHAMDYKGTLTIGIEDTADSVHVSIADEGTGIPESIRDRIFEPFFTTKKQGDGIGLGLDIIRKTIDFHDGKLRFDTQPGKTVFHVYLGKN